MFRELVKLDDNPFRKYVEYVEDNTIKGMMEYSIMYDKMELDNIIVLTYPVTVFLNIRILLLVSVSLLIISHT